jgi:hypothetical protein
MISRWPSAPGCVLLATLASPDTPHRDDTAFGLWFARCYRFEEVVITGNRTQGIRINDASCQPNTLADSLVKDNRLEDISLASPASWRSCGRGRNDFSAGQGLRRRLGGDGEATPPRFPL